MSGYSYFGLLPQSHSCDNASMTTLEAHVAQGAQNADPAKASDAPSPAAKAPGEIKTPSDYQAAKADLLAPATHTASEPAPSTAQPAAAPDNIEQQILRGEEDEKPIPRDEFGDQIHNHDDVDEPALPAAPAKVEGAEPTDDPDRILPHRIPTKQFSAVEQEAMVLKHELEKQNPGHTFALKDCLDRVEAKYGVKPAPEAKPGSTLPELDPNLPSTLGDLNAQKTEATKSIREKRLEIARAETELRYEDKLRLVEELNGLEEKIDTLNEHAGKLATHEDARATQYQTGYSASAARTLELYPDANVKGSQLFNRMAEIDALFLETNDPRYFAEDKPLVVAQLAAAELRIAPKGRPAAKASATTPQPPVTASHASLPQHMAPPVASGSARTSTPAEANVQIDSIRTPEQLENYKLTLVRRPSRAA